MSWSSVKTEGVVLKTHPFREADRRYSVLTPAHGKVQFVGRGAQKGLAKLASHLEPFSIVDLEYIRGRRSTTVISVDMRHRFKYLDSQLDRRLFAGALLQLLDWTTDQNETDTGLYQLLVDWLQFLDREDELPATRATFLLGGFLLRLMNRLGYQIEMRQCVNCQQDIFPLAFRWHAGHGGLVCTDCVQAKKEEWFTARQVSEEAVKLLRFARDEKLEDLLRVPLKGEYVSEFANMVHDLFTFHLPGKWERPFWTAILADIELEERPESV